MGIPILTDKPFFKLTPAERRAIIEELKGSLEDVAMWFHYGSLESVALVVEEYHICENALRPTVEIVGTLEGVPRDATRNTLAKGIAGVFEHWTNAGDFQMSLTGITLEELEELEDEA
jgi:hypothetical protein